MINLLNKVFLQKLVLATILLSGFALSFSFAEAASLYLSPATGVYQANTTFTARVMVNTGGQPVNAAEGTIKFNPSELSVVSVNRSSSIFNLWVAEPAFSNSAGTISFSGGIPSGYSSNTGTIMTVTFRAKGSGPAKVNFSSGSVLANDGRGTNILTGMNGGTYTIQAKSETPEPEVIEYVAPANTPGKPRITSVTHPDPLGWHKSEIAELAWAIPADVTSVRTLLDSSPSTVPTKVYETPINKITIEDLDEGVSYFHLQFKNEDGWGVINHYRLAVDKTAPTDIKISLLDETDTSNPNQLLKVEVKDEMSEVRKFSVKLDDNEPFEYIDETGSSTIVLPTLEPGYHSVIIEAFDEAGNSTIGTFSFTLEAFDKPVFTEYPSEINEEVIPVIKGNTRPNSKVTITLQKISSEATEYQVMSDETGEFVFIPEGTFSTGVWEIFAVAKDEYGALSAPSDTIKIAVQQPGYLRIGSLIVSILSVIIPLIVLLIILGIGLWYFFTYFRRFRKKVRFEAREALEILRNEFTELQTTLRQQESAMQSSRKTKKLTKAESDMIQVMDKALQNSQRRVEKEISDITDLAKKKEK